MGYTNATMKNACIAIAFLSNQTNGADAATIRSSCAFSRKACERLLIALLSCGAVTRKAVKPPKARGARSRYFYFAAIDDPAEDGAEETLEESVAIDCAEDDDEDKGAGHGGGGGGSFDADVEFPTYESEPVFEDCNEFSVVFDGEISPANFPRDGENFGEIIDGENREIIDASLSININTQERKINKRARAKRALGNNKNTQIGNTSAARLNALVASVDLDDPEARSLRRKIASIVWDPNTRAELLDRAVAAVKLGFIRVCEIVNKARRSVDEAKRAGCDVWYKFTLVVKGAFDKEGVEWVPTRPGAEPSPFLNRLVSLRLNDTNEEEIEPRVIRTNDGRNVVVFG